jgi:peptidyl-prolyl cis-trans isomerase D
MIGFFRTTLGDWLVRIILILIVVSFVGYGVSTSIISSSSNQVVISSSSSAITAQQLVAEYNRQLRATLRSSNTAPNSLIKAQVFANSVAAMAERIIYQEERAVNDVEFDLQNIKQEIMRTYGIIDPQFISGLVRNLDITEDDFIAYQENQMFVNYLTRPLVDSQGFSPIFLRERLFANDNKKRAFGLAFIPIPKLDDIKNPSAEKLKQLYDRGNYTSPEKRKIRYILVDRGEYLHGISVTAEQVEQYYRSQKDRFIKPEQRKVERLLFKTEKSAKEYIKNNKKIDRNLDNYTLLGFVSKKDLLPPLAKAIFAKDVKLNTILKQPIKVELGWNVITVMEIAEDQSKSLQDATKEIQAILVQQQVTNQFNDEISQIEDIIIDLGTIDDITASFSGFEVHEAEFSTNLNGLSISSNKKNKQQQWLANQKLAQILINNKGWLNNIFTLQGSQTEIMFDDESGLALVASLEKVTPEQELNYEDAKEQIVSDYKSKQVKQKTETIINDLYKNLRDNKAKLSLEQIAKRSKWRYEESDKIKRTSLKVVYDKDSEKLLEFKQSMFNTPMGTYGHVVDNIGGNIVFGVPLDEQLPPVIRFTDKLAQLYTNNLEKQMQGEFMSQYLGNLRSIHPVKIDQNVMLMIRKSLKL